jgi:hypothetical protein
MEDVSHEVSFVVRRSWFDVRRSFFVVRRSSFSFVVLVRFVIFSCLPCVPRSRFLFRERHGSTGVRCAIRAGEL